MGKVKLQLALDLEDLNDALKLAEQTSDYIDIIELGTPLIKVHGLKTVCEAFSKFNKPLLADLKTMDTGEFEAMLAFKYGADYMTVCAAADNKTIQDAAKYANENSKHCMVDLLSAKDVVKRAQEIKDLGPSFVCVHSGIDMQLQGCCPLNDLKKVKGVMDNVAVAGGITLETAPQALEQNPAILIIGGAITRVDNPREAAKQFRQLVDQ